MRCSVYIAVSVDGFIARKDDGLDWLTRVEVPGEDYGYKAFSDTVDVLVMGRRTYEVCLRFPEWPYSGQRKRVIVLSRSAPELRHADEIFAGTPEELVKRLASEGVQRAYIDGGAVIRSFLGAGLIDDLTLSVIPVLLGRGIPLFGPEIPDHHLEVEESRAFPSGLVQTHYRVAKKMGVAVENARARSSSP
jgi:dihydrofolate reductase